MRLVRRRTLSASSIQSVYVPVPPVLFLTVPVLVWLLDGVGEPTRSRRRRVMWRAGLVGWWFGFGYFLLSLYWVGNALLVEAEKYAFLLPLAVTLLPAGLALFTGAAAAFAVFRLAALAIEILFRRLPRPHNTTIRLAFANLHRPGAATTTVTLALGLGLTVLTAVVLMEENLARQVDHTIPKTAPAYYFIDIQPKQRLAFETLVKRQPSITRVAQVPVLRGRILKLAGVPAARIEAPPEVAWVLRGDRGLTWSREPPTEGSKVVEGVWWPKDYDGPPLVSFDQAKARAFGLKIGDTITINLLGRPLTARIANLRAIKWDSLSINFLMIFSPGTMKGAPLSYLATAHFEANASEKDERATASAVTDEFPNISAIRVKDVLSDVSKIVADIGIAVRASASVAIIAGILVLAGAIADPDGSGIAVALEMGNLFFRKIASAENVVHRSQFRLVPLRRMHQPVEIGIGFVLQSAADEGRKHEIGIAHLAIAVIPVTLAADPFRERRCGGGRDRARFAAGQQPQGHQTQPDGLAKIGAVIAAR